MILFVSRSGSQTVSTVVNSDELFCEVSRYTHSTFVSTGTTIITTCNNKERVGKRKERQINRYRGTSEKDRNRRKGKLSRLQRTDETTSQTHRYRNRSAHNPGNIPASNHHIYKLRKIKSTEYKSAQNFEASVSRIVLVLLAG